MCKGGHWGDLKCGIVGGERADRRSLNTLLGMIILFFYRLHATTVEQLLGQSAVVYGPQGRWFASWVSQTGQH